MSKQANPVKVGAFVLTGLVILIVTAGLLGSARFFTKPVSVVMYFDSSVKGLVLGSPVKFKGVNIGQVVDISLLIGDHKDGPLIPVLVEIDRDSIKQTPGSVPVLDPVGLKEAIDNGLRATLQMESFVTGRLNVSLDVYPDAGKPIYHGDGSVMEIPTKATGLEKFLQSLTEVDIPGMANKLTLILTQLNESLGQLKVKELNDRLASVLESANKLVSSPQLIETVEAFRKTAEDAQKVLASLQSEIRPIGDSLNQTSKAATVTLNQLNATLQNLQRILSAESPTMSELNGALEEIGQAARSLKNLSDELTREPSVILKGRPRP